MLASEGKAKIQTKRTFHMGINDVIASAIPFQIEAAKHTATKRRNRGNADVDAFYVLILIWQTMRYFRARAFIALF